VLDFHSITVVFSWALKAYSSAWARAATSWYFRGGITVLQLMLYLTTIHAFGKQLPGYGSGN